MRHQVQWRVLQILGLPDEMPSINPNVIKSPGDLFTHPEENPQILRDHSAHFLARWARLDFDFRLLTRAARRAGFPAARLLRPPERLAAAFLAFASLPAAEVAADRLRSR